MTAPFPQLDDRGFANVASTHNVIYIGSTHLKRGQREHSRLAKFKQLDTGKLPKVEIAQRYWQSNGNYHNFTTPTLAVTQNIAKHGPTSMRSSNNGSPS